MTHEEKRIFLIKKLLFELPQYKDIEIPEQEEEQKRLLRSLMNIRPPRPVSKEFLKVQNTYLREEAARIAVRTVMEFLQKDVRLERIVFNVFKEEDKWIYKELLGDVTEM